MLFLSDANLQRRNIAFFSFLIFELTCSLAEVFPSADLGLLGGLSMRGSDRRECLPIAFGPVTSLDIAFIPR